MAAEPPRPPFKIQNPAGASVNPAQHAKSPSKGAVFQHAVREGEELYEAAREDGSAPDREVGKGAPKMVGKGPVGDGEFPDHPAAIPWPQPAAGVDHKPMKLR